jgi:HSP20 family protein
MNSVIRWDPFSDRLSLRDAVDRLMQDSFVLPTIPLWRSYEGNLAVDLYEKDDNVLVEAAVPGFKPEEIDINVSGETLTIKGETKTEKESKDNKNYIRRERTFGSFERIITLPEGLDTDKASAKFENGVLTLTFPKSEKVKPKTIKIQAK